MNSEKMKTEWRQFQAKVLENWDSLTLEGNPMITGKWDLFAKRVQQQRFQNDRVENQFERVPTQPESDDWITWERNHEFIPDWEPHSVQEPGLALAPLDIRHFS
jgi:hypothetical protein